MSKLKIHFEKYSTHLTWIGFTENTKLMTIWTVKFHLNGTFKYIMTKGVICDIVICDTETQHLGFKQ